MSAQAARSERPAMMSADAAGERSSQGGAGVDLGGAEDAGADEPTRDAGAAEGDQPPTAAEIPALDAVVLAAETADAEALAQLGGFAELPVFRRARYEQKSSRDRGKPLTPLESLAPILSAGNRDMNNFVCKSQDAKLGGTQLVPYNFDEALCPESYVHGAVLTRHVGSGRLVRFWLTASTISSADARLGAEVLRIYVDDDPAPVIQVPLAEALSGAAGEIFAPPFGAASPNFIAWYYPVVFSEKVLVVLDHLETEYYFQTDAVLDPEPRQRRAARERLPERDRIREALSAGSPLPANATMLQEVDFALAAGASQDVTWAGPSTIQEVAMHFDQAALASLHDVKLTVTWDEREPAIDLPLLDLFAASAKPVEISNLALAASAEAGRQQVALRLPMPFRKTTTWRVTSAAAVETRFKLTWRGAQGTPQGEHGYFHVQRNDVAIPATELEVPVAQVSGRGRYVGMCADVAGNLDRSLGLMGDPMNFLEGDFRATVDGRVALDGTGAEDYPDNSFYFLDCPKATAFAQAWGRLADARRMPAGEVSYCRWQVLGNEIDFESELSLTHELSQRDPALATLHRTLAYLYLP